MKKIILIALGYAFLMPALSGCNTTEGLGRDLSKAGDAISGAAEKTSRKMDEQNKAPTSKKSEYK